MMMGIYTVVLTFSSYLISLLGTRAFLRIARSGGLPKIYSQLAMVLAMIGFLTVVSMPTGVLLAALLAAAVAAITNPHNATAGRGTLLPLLAAVVLGTVGVWESPGAWPASVPLIGFLLLAAVVFAGALFATRTAEVTLPVLVGITVAAALPLMIAPLVFANAHGSMALDEAIILAALLGGIIVQTAGTVVAGFVRLPLAVLMAYGAIQAMHYGAWPLGIVSLLIWLAGVKLAPRANAGQF